MLTLRRRRPADPGTLAARADALRLELRACTALANEIDLALTHAIAQTRLPRYPQRSG